MSDIDKDLLAVKDAFISQQQDTIKQQSDEIDRLKGLLIVRDGGAHDVDCKSNYNHMCNCGHDTVKALTNNTEG